jgi:plasmid stabilization system protein ParE
MDFKVIWSDAAIADLRDICSYIARHDAQAAQRMGRGILDHIRILGSFPLIGPAYPENWSLVVQPLAAENQVHALRNP